MMFDKLHELVKLACATSGDNAVTTIEALDRLARLLIDNADEINQALNQTDHCAGC